MLSRIVLFFFFQAEDGIRDKLVTGVQTCALPILARAFVGRPKAFLMDEPLSNLDAKLRAQTRRELVDLHRRVKTTVVYVTHDQVEALTMATRIAIMSGGVLQQVGTPAEVYESPANLFVAGFVGTPPMNCLTGTFSTDGGAAV